MIRQPFLAKLDHIERLVMDILRVRRECVSQLLNDHPKQSADQYQLLAAYVDTLVSVTVEGIGLAGIRQGGFLACQSSPQA